MDKELRKPRVLVTTVGAWSSRNGSDTMSSLMHEYGSENVAAIYIRADKSDSKSASRYLHIIEGRVIKSILHPSVTTCEEYRPGDVCITKSSDEQLAEKVRYSVFSKHRWGLFIFVREFVWKLGHWKSKELNAFLDDYNPEVLVCPIESYIHFNTLNEYIIRRCNPKVIGFLWDDNFTYSQDPYNFWHQIHRVWLRRSVRRLVGKCNTVFCLSPKMKVECDKEFGIESQLLTKPIFNQGLFTPYQASFPIRILYTGKLIIGRDKAIAEVVEAVRDINRDERKVVLDIYTNTELSADEERRLSLPGCCNLHGPIPQSDVFVKQREADVLLFVESLSCKRKIARLSFSTKLTDYFSAGKCIWGVGNADLGPIDYLRSEDAGLVSTDRDSIKKVIQSIVDTPSIVGEYAKKAFECGVRNHDAKVIINKLYKAIKV